MSSNITVPDIYLDDQVIYKVLHNKEKCTVKLTKPITSKDLVVVKSYPLYKKYIRGNLLSEIDMLVKLQHKPNILQLKHICLTNNSLSIITERMIGNLRNLTNECGLNIRVRNLNNLTYSMLHVLSFFEKNNIYYTDIKPHNILYGLKSLNGDFSVTHDKKDMYIFKLCDLEGIKTNVSISKLHDIVLTMHYIPPEIISNRDKSTIDPSKCVLWSLGITILEFLIGHYIFHSTGDKINRDSNSSHTSKYYSNPIFKEMWDYALTNNSIEDFYQNNKNGNLINDRLDIENIIDKHTFLNNKSSKINKVVDILKELLLFNPNKRTSATDLLIKYYKPVEEIITVKRKFTRVIYSEGIDVILRLMKDITKYSHTNNMMSIIAIEIYTRFLGFIKDNVEIVEKEKSEFEIEKYISKNELIHAAVASLDIVSDYTKKEYNFDYDLVYDYKDVENEDEQITDELDDEYFDPKLFSKMVHEVLKTLNFLIYNNELDIYWDNRKQLNSLQLNTIPYTRYLQEINSWFPNL